jgi:hypothetical protein
MPSVSSTVLPAATTATDMIRIITLIIFSLCITANAASLKLITKEKTAGLPSGLYFQIDDIDPFIMYKLQYSEDLVTWHEMVRLGTYKTSMVSPFWGWDELPPQKCFFRLVLAQ